MLHFSSKKIGGLRFVRIGSLSFSYCFTKKAPKPSMSRALTVVRSETYEPRVRSIAAGRGRVFTIA